MTSISAASGSAYQSPPPVVAGAATVRRQFRHYQLDRPERIVFRADRHRFLREKRRFKQLFQQRQRGARRYQIEDRQPDRRRSLERQIDRRSGHRIARCIPERVRQWSWWRGWIQWYRGCFRRGGCARRPRWSSSRRSSSGWSRRRASRSSWQRFVIRYVIVDRRHQQFIRHQFGGRRTSAIPPIVAGFAIEARHRHPTLRPATPPPAATPTLRSRRC